MSKYELPIDTFSFGDDDHRHTIVVDNIGKEIPFGDIARDLTEFYTLKAMQESCDHCYKSVFENPPWKGKKKYNSRCCPWCGKLIRGVK